MVMLPGVRESIEIPTFEFKLTANKSYGAGTVGDRLGAGVKLDRG
jgi:hypothetical protein